MNDTAAQLQTRYGHAIFQAAHYQKVAQLLRDEIEAQAITLASAECSFTPHADAERASTSAVSQVALGHIQNAPWRSKLTQSELAIATFVSNGLSNKQIAAKAGTTEQVIKSRLRRIYATTRTKSRLQLALLVRKSADPSTGSCNITRSPSLSKALRLQFQDGGKYFDVVHVVANKVRCSPFEVSLVARGERRNDAVLEHLRVEMARRDAQQPVVEASEVVG